MRAPVVGDDEGWFCCRYFPTFGAAGVDSSGLRTEAALPRAERLTLASRARSCSGVRVLMPSFTYLKEARFRDSRFWGSCRVMMSFRLNPSSLTRSRHIFALTFKRSTVS